MLDSCFLLRVNDPGGMIWLHYWLCMIGSCWKTAKETRPRPWTHDRDDTLSVVLEVWVRTNAIVKSGSSMHESCIASCTGTGMFNLFAPQYHIQLFFGSVGCPLASLLALWPWEKLQSYQSQAVLIDLPGEL